MRAILDPNVIISAILSAVGAPAGVLRSWQRGEFELVVSPRLLAELERALGYPKLAKRIPATDARELVGLLRRSAVLADDPTEPPPARSQDPGDDYLLALAAAERAHLVSGDRHLLSLAGELPILSAREFVALLEATQ